VIACMNVCVCVCVYACVLICVWLCGWLCRCAGVDVGRQTVYISMGVHVIAWVCERN